MSSQDEQIQQRRANLGPVPMSDDQPIAASNQANDGRRRASRIGQLFGDSSLLSRPDQGVAADGDENGFHGGCSQ